MRVTLQQFDPSSLPRLRGWLDQLHVSPWYPDPLRDMGIATNPPPGGFHTLIAVDDVPIGYMRWQYVDRATLDELGLQEIPANSVDIDILLGEEAATAKGVGPTALNLLAAKLLEDTAVPTLGLTTSINNFRAQHAFAKAGFRILLQYDPSGHGLCHLMIRDLRPERSRGSSV